MIHSHAANPMAPAAAETIKAHFKDTGRQSDYYDLIITGDLGTLGRDILNDLMMEDGYDIQKKYTDCGAEMFDKNMQGTDCGGSGCGCSAAVLNGNILKRMRAKELNKVLFVATGALMSPLALQQGGNIIGIAHAVAIENDV
jgi:stage V sporulation protein AD